MVLDVYKRQDVAKAKEIIATVSAEKAAHLPEQMIQNIAKGRLGKFFKEVCLLNQEDIMDGKKTVREVEKVVKESLGNETKEYEYKFRVK